ncbi:MAG: hypothetical protein AAF982_06295 [Pseudomonadota bacterium]
MPAEGVDLGYRSRAQFVAFHHRRQRWACVVAHRRAGKTVACVVDLIEAVLRCPRPNPRFAYLAPFYTQAKDVAWTYLKHYGGAIPGARPNEGELRLDFPNGGRVRLYGADNYDRLRGIYLDGCVLDEYGDMNPRAWSEVIRPALSDRKGWGVFIGTPKGRNAFYHMYQRARHSPDWFEMCLRASETGLIDAEELASARDDMTPEQYAQEFECSFDAAIVGAYYAALVVAAEGEGRIGDIGADPDLPIHTAWDLGIGDSTAIWVFQIGPEGMRLIDHIEDHGKPLPHYVAELEARGYGGGIDYVPHDAKVRSLDTGRSRLETLAGLGRRPFLLPPATVEDGINGVRQLFPRMWFDARRCARGLESLRNYRTEFDEKAGVFKNRPKHDWTSHTADALRYAAQGYRDMAVRRIRAVQKSGPGQVWIGPPEMGRKKRRRL